MGEHAGEEERLSAKDTGKREDKKRDYNHGGQILDMQNMCRDCGK